MVPGEALGTRSTLTCALRSSRKSTSLPLPFSLSGGKKKKRERARASERAGVLRGKVYEFSKSQLTYLRRIPPLSQLHTVTVWKNSTFRETPVLLASCCRVRILFSPVCRKGGVFTCCSLPTWYEKASRRGQKSPECTAVSDCGDWQSHWGSLNSQENLF